MPIALATETLYSVDLCDFPGLPTPARLEAEARYGKALEKSLGSSESVVAAYGAWCYAAEGDGSDADEEDKALALRWVKAVDAARQAGFRGLSEDEGAYFEVRLG